MSREVEFATNPDVDLVAYIAGCAFKPQGNGRHDGDVVVEDPRGRSDSRRHVWNLPTIRVLSRSPARVLFAADFCSTVVLD